MIKRFIYDLETCGTKPWRHNIHQLYAQIEIDGVIKESIDLKIQPSPHSEIDLESLKIGGVTLEQVKAYPNTQADAHKKVVELLRRHVYQYNRLDKCYLLGYNNASFDDGFLRGLFKQNNDEYFGAWFWSGSMDVMVLASDYLAPVRHMLKDFKLKTVAAYLGITIDESKLHEAGYDVYLTRQIYHMIKVKPSLGNV